MNYKDKRILVTGGAGFIGSEVVAQLTKKNATVTVLDNFSSGKKQYLKNNKKNLKIIKGDITDEKIVSKAYIKMTQYQIGKEDAPSKNGRTLLNNVMATERTAVLR